MSKKASTTAIGFFVLGAIVVTVAFAILMGSFKLFTKSETFIIYFDQSVNGLGVGAPVKYRGVDIGQVTDVKIRYNQDQLSTHIPVFIEVNLTRLASELGFTEDLGDEDYYTAMINDGLRAKLQMDGLITGLLYIDLEYQSEAPVIFVQEEIIYKEIPSMPSALAEIQQSATEIIARLSYVDFESISDELVAFLNRLNDGVDEIDFGRINDSVADATEAIRDLARNPKIDTTLDTLESTLAQYRQLAARIDDQVDVVMEGAGETNEALQATLLQFRDTGERINALLSPQASFRYRIENAMEELGDAAEAIRRLADFLERNPRALLTGKQKTEEGE